MSAHPPAAPASPATPAEPSRLLAGVHGPADLRALASSELPALAAEIRELIVRSVSVDGGHLGSNRGVVELTLALHRVFDSRRDVILWDTGHQACAHEIVTGRGERFTGLRRPGGLPGCPSRAEPEHDWVENSHASTVLSYAHGLSVALAARGEGDRRVVAVVGDGSLTGGIAYEALNNLGHGRHDVLVVLNDHGRSYPPTVGGLADGATRLRLSPAYARTRDGAERALRAAPGIGRHLDRGLQGVLAAAREAMLDPGNVVEALGVRSVGPVDGHDAAAIESVLRQARDQDGPVLVHALTPKGFGYPPAETDDERCLPGARVSDPATGPPRWGPTGFTQAFADAMGSHPGVLDLALLTQVPGMTVLAPSSAPELAAMLDHALSIDGPVAIRYPRGRARSVAPAHVGTGLHARRVGDGAAASVLVNARAGGRVGAGGMPPRWQVPDRLLVRVGADGAARGRVSARLAHCEPGVLHLAVSVQIVDPVGDLWLLQRRAGSKPLFPERWTNTCCTHPAPGEDVAQAARRRLREETALDVDHLTLAGEFTYRAPDGDSGLVEHEHDYVFVAVADTSGVVADPEEISDLARLPYAEALRLVESDAGTPWAAEVLRRARATLGPATAASRDGASSTHPEKESNGHGN